MINRRKFLVALGAIPVVGVCLEKGALVDDHATNASKVTHVMADEIAKMRVGDIMRDGYVIGFDATLRAKHQRELTAWLRNRVDNHVFRMLTNGK